MKFCVLFGLSFLFLFGNLKNASAKTLSEIWNEFDVKTDLSLKRSLEVGGFLLNGKSGYAYSVKKVFLKSKPKFQRTDGYLLNLGVGLGSGEIGQVSLNGEAQVTYVRNFDYKRQALLAKPNFKKSFPRRAVDITNNPDALNVGDSVRIEFSSGSSLSTRISNLFEGALIEDFSLLNTLGASVFLKRGTSFLIDVYRLNESRVRLKIVAVRNTGTVGAGLSARSALLAGIGVPLAESVIKRIVKCDFNLDFSKKVSKRYPTDTIIADYSLDLKNRRGALLYDDFMQTLFTVQISRHVNLFRNSMQFENAVAPLISPLDYASSDYIIFEESSPVSRIFKGRMLSDSSSVGASSSCFKLFDLHKMKFKNLSVLRSYDKWNVPSDYMMYNLGLDKDGLFDDRTNNYHHIWTAKRTDESNPLSARPLNLNTLTLNKILVDEYSRKKGLLWFLPGEHESLVNELVNLYPFQINKDHFRGVFEKDEVNLVSNLKVSLNKNILDSLRPSTASHARDWATQTVEDLKTVGVYFYLGNENSPEAQPHHLNTYVRSVTPLINPERLSYISNVRGFDQESQVDYVFSHYNKLLNSRLFRQIGFPYLMSLADKEILNSNISFNYSLAVGHKQNKKDFQIEIPGPEDDVSRRALEALRVINNRDFDLSLGD
jgi:hypothetical protein